LPMATKIMKWVSIAGLLLGVMWRSSPNYQLLLQFLVCAGAILVALQAARAAKYSWAVGFSAIAVLYNPILSVALSRNMFLWLNLVCLATFVVSLSVLKTRPITLVTVAKKSITNQGWRVTA